MARRQDENQYGSPTGFTGFDDYFNANAGAAKKAAGGVEEGVQDAAEEAQGGLSTEYENFQNNVKQGVKSGMKSGKYEGPAAFDPSDALMQAYGDLRAKRDALGSEKGVQASLGKKATGMDAALTRRAGASAFDTLRAQYAGMDRYLDDARMSGQKLAAGGQKQVSNLLEKQKQADTLNLDAAENARRYQGLLEDEERRRYEDAMREEEERRNAGRGIGDTGDGQISGEQGNEGYY